MTTKRDSKEARANLWVTRQQQKNIAGSAQVRAFKAREIAKQKRDLVARKLAAQQAADAAKRAKAAAAQAEANSEAKDPQESAAPESSAPEVPAVD